MLRALTFDFWGTLYQNAFGREERLDLLERALRQAGRPRRWEELEAAYEHAWQAFEQVWRQENRPFSIEEWVGEMLSFLGAELPEEVQCNLYRPLQEALLDSPPRPVPGVAEVLPRLARRYRLGLISDVGLTPGRVLREFLRRDGLFPYFRTLTFSDEAGLTKPRPEVFWRTLEALEAHPEEAAHVGDLPETDLVGARNAGMRAILFLGVSRREDGRDLADAVFTDYRELEEVLEAL